MARAQIELRYWAAFCAATLWVMASTPLSAQPHGDNATTGLSTERSEPVVQLHSVAEAQRAPVGRVVRFVDADSGAPRRPTAKEVDALLDAARAMPFENGKPPIPVIELPDGELMAPLPPEYDVHHGEHDDAAIVGRGR